MRFMKDDQRKAMFANMGRFNKFAAIPNIAVEELSAKQDDYVLAKGPSALGRDKFLARPVIKEELETLPEEGPVQRPKHAVSVSVGGYQVVRGSVPIADKYKEHLAQYLSEGVPYEQAETWVKNEELADQYEAGSALESKYYSDLIEAYEKSGADDFEKYKKRFNKTYEGKKFSRKSKRDFDAVYERGDDDYVCSYCGDSFSSKLTAAIHAGRCDDNAFADEDFDFGLDPEDAGNDGFSV